jgi:hypothetical protein
MHEFWFTKYGPQIQRVCPEELGRADKGGHVSEQRAVVLFENQYSTPQSSCMLAIAAVRGG